MTRDLTSRLKAAEHAVMLARQLLAEAGPLRLVDDQLYAGDRLLNGDTTIVDAVYEATLFGCTLFVGGERVATRATERGQTERATGTRASPEIVAQVYEGGEVFAGSTETLGRRWAIVYEPLNDADGRRIGMIAGYREIVG